MREISLFTPFSSRGTTFANRIVVSPMCQYRAVEGQVGAWHLAHHARFALGGVGGALIEATAVERDGRISEGCLGLWHDGQIAGFRQLAGLYRDQGIPLGVQIGHAGRKASSASPWDGAGPLAEAVPPRGWTAIAPSALAHADGWPIPVALDEAGIARIVAAFAASARRAVEAGLDFVELHGAHGYLLHEFLSPLANHRTDRYGGAFDNRARLALEAALAVRQAVPEAMPVWYRASCVDESAGGVTLDETVELARRLKNIGIDLLDCSSGGIRGPVARSIRAEAPGHQVPYAERIRREAGMATMAVGLITEPEQANRIISDGSADFVAIGRELLADPNFVYRAARALGHPFPHEVLPRNFAFFLARRNMLSADAVTK
ncbi:NADH:flavin oxidoreductase [Burkholderia sp. Ch1-1]|uniref:NADPH dehydrogenase n=1 Tax=Paraburkholderia dioscoreae TaxID=2604047 RepID=A0A5Q4ZNZ7_9BURK|nr:MULTISPECIES: NADH:flavin oxidoreductase/NADH oxidase [Paraburkholderia]EIF35376.1 NADH:flavin oxidoreductase [Burkholderia sp. Ch1-1]MDR8397257.1 NADH:flavin oxidoreductase/NADH oxidase [Paraburkholderia sp. USG1]VVD34613.1 NADPH dehydrogenase [Paraburkholderia dioscoreae]